MSQHTNKSTILLLLLESVLAASCVTLLYAFWQSLSYQWTGPYTVDTPMYWAVGRGIVKGLIPYKDLFEVKPPGIFLLSALSIWLKGDMSLSGLMQTSALFFMPVLLGISAFRITRTNSRHCQLFAIGTSVAFGMILALYSGERSGEFQVESFGAFFTVMYAAVLAWDGRKLGLTRTLLAALAIFGAVGMKEPFLLIALAVALIWAQRPTDLVRSFVIPLLIAGASGLIALYLLNYADAYFTLYLPEVVGKKIAGGPPLWLRGFFFDLTYQDLRGFIPAFAWILVFLSGMTLLRLRHVVPRRHSVFVIMATALALYLLVFSIGIRGTYWNHHFVFATGGYAALFLVFIRESHLQWHRRSPRLAMIALVGLITCASMQMPTIDYAARVSIVQSEEASVEDSAAYIDAVLDACHLDTYLFLGGNGSQPYGFTKHSPIGPMFTQFNEWMESDRPQFREQMLKQVSDSMFVVKDNLNLNWLNVPVNRHLEQYFTTNPWPCAENIPKDYRYQYLFRYAQPSLPLTETAKDLVF